MRGNFGSSPNSGEHHVSFRQKVSGLSRLLFLFFFLIRNFFDVEVIRLGSRGQVWLEAYESNVLRLAVWAVIANEFDVNRAKPIGQLVHCFSAFALNHFLSLSPSVVVLTV